MTTITDYQRSAIFYAHTLGRLDAVTGAGERTHAQARHLIWAHLIALSEGQGARADSILLDQFVHNVAAPAYQDQYRREAAGSRAQIADREEPHWRRQPRGGFQRPSGEL